MSYGYVTVYTPNGDFIGYSILQEGAKKLHTANIWSENPEEIKDLEQQLGRLNDQGTILTHWPDVRDPDVQALLSDDTWNPVEKSPQEVVDEDASIFVWLEEPNDENPYGRADEDASVIITKTIMVPAPADVQRRVKLACETVARQRANA